MRVREAATDDRKNIAAVHRLAFGGDAEAKLVGALHSGGFATISLVAEDDGGIAGHVLFSPLTITTRNGTLAALALAPVAVLPEKQRQGIGTRLITQGLDRATIFGHGAVIVVGAPAYYSRFGFSSAMAHGLDSPYSSFGDAWMAMELTPEYLRDVRGVVRYAPPFQNMES